VIEGVIVKEIIMNYKDNNEQTKFVALFMKKMNIRVNDMVKLLDVSANTIYNYRTMDDQDIPLKVKDKLFDMLGVNDYQEARKALLTISDERRSQIASSMGSLLMTTMMVNTESYKNNDNNKNDISNNLEDSLGSKVYVNALFYEIKKVVKSKDDYDFISYVKKYNG